MWDVTDSRTPKPVKCNKHKKMWNVSYDNHVRGGRGCPICRYEKSAKSKTYSISHVKALCKNAHPSFDIIESSYTNFTNHADFICKTHGIFTKTPQIFCESVFGCTLCAEQKGAIKSRRLTREESLERLNHLPHLDFSETVFGNAQDYIKFYCTIHKKYHKTKFNNLVHFKGCDLCGQDSSKSKQLGWINFTTIELHSEKYKNQTNHLYLYKLLKEGKDVYKIGIARSLSTRKNKLDADFGETVLIHYVLATTYKAFYAEQTVQRLLKGNKYSTEEVNLPNGNRKRGYSELFTISPDKLEEVKALMDFSVEIDWSNGRDKLDKILEVNNKHNE